MSDYWLAQVLSGSIITGFVALLAWRYKVRTAAVVREITRPGGDAPGENAARSTYLKAEIARLTRELEAAERG